MSMLTNSFGKSDGASLKTHAAMKEAGVGPYDTPAPPPPPPPSISEQISQVGSVQRTNTAGLKAKLMERGMSEKEATARIAQNNKATGLR